MKIKADIHFQIVKLPNFQIELPNLQIKIWNMNVNYDELIMLTGGAFLTVWGFAKMNERSKLLANGIKAEGVVFDIEKSFDFTDSSSSGRLHYPIIRFVTVDKEWVTRKYEIGSYPSAFDVGDKVTVVYDTADCNHFIIDNWQSKLTWLVVATVGVLLIFGVIIYFFVNQYPSL